MKRVEILIDGDRQWLEVGRGSCRFEGVESAVEIADLGEGGYSVIVDGSQFAVHVDRGNEESFDVTVDGSVLTIGFPDPRRPPSQRSRESPFGAQEIRAPMPGKVIAVLVSEGERVDQGQALLVVEAMKMQNELRSPRDGAVSAVHVAAGDSVSSGDALVVVE